MHRVLPGDSFASLAKSYYGSERYADFLMKANPQVTDPRRMALGTAIKIPPLPSDLTRDAQVAASRTPSVAASARTYRVRPGDSFYRIARDILGDAARWRELFELNEALVNGNPRTLRPGQVILLPDK
jgi:nucleoid-associated protein YgaU